MGACRLKVGFWSAENDNSQTRVSGFGVYPWSSRQSLKQAVGVGETQEFRCLDPLAYVDAVLLPVARRPWDHSAQKTTSSFQVQGTPPANLTGVARAPDDGRTGGQQFFHHVNVAFLRCGQQRRAPNSAGEAEGCMMHGILTWSTLKHDELSSCEEVLLNRTRTRRGQELSTGMKVRSTGRSEESKGEARLAKASQHGSRRTVGTAAQFFVLLMI